MGGHSENCQRVSTSWFFPIKLSKAFTTACLFGEEAVKDLLLESFLAYLSSDERELVNLSLSGQLGEEQEKTG